MANILEATNVTKRFGGLTAVDDLTFSIPTGSIVSIIGPNGAGKTTFFNCVTGFYGFDEGDIMFSGAVLTMFFRVSGRLQVRRRLMPL